MKDRISLYPGRVRLTPVSGQTNVYDLERADEPLQEGTPLNKNSILKDATAALFGMTENALPDEVLAKIALILNGGAEYYSWTKQEIEITIAGSTQSVSLSATITYSSEVGFDDSGNAGLSNSTSASRPTSTTAVNSLLSGKYFEESGQIYKYVSCASASSKSATVNAYLVTLTITRSSVISTNRNEYPDKGKADSVTYYIYLGNLLQPGILKYECCAYVGTGVYGESNPNQLTFTKPPKKLTFTAYFNGTYFQNAGQDVGASPSEITFDLKNIGNTYTRYRLNTLDFYIKVDGETVYWYTSDAADQLNASQRTYYAEAWM